MTGSTTFPYESATAFDAALKQRFQEAAKSGPYSLNELRRQFAYDRLLARAFTAAPDRWILKGGGGLLARIPGQARHSMDIDLFYLGELVEALSELQELAAGQDFGDFFTFDISRNRGDLDKNAKGMNLGVTSFLGEKEFQRFNIDLVISSNMTQDPDVIEGLAPVSVPGLKVVDYIVYSIVDHIADKHAAMLETYGDGDKPSSRYRDLVDIVLLATTQEIDARQLRQALLSEYEYRGLAVPERVDAPDVSWEAGYAAEAAKVPHLKHQTLSSGLEVAGVLLLPVLAEEISGSWNPEGMKWEILD